PGPGRRVPARHPRARARRAPARDLRRGRRGDHLQLPALHGAPALRVAGADRRPPARGGRGSLREQASGVHPRHAAALRPRDRGGDAAHVHPGGRRLHQRATPRDAPAIHGRQRDPVEVPRRARLPCRRRVVVHPDGPHPGGTARLRAHRRHREADRLMRWVRHHLLPAYAFLAFCYLLLPIGVVILFSFNAPSGRFNYVWEGFTFDNWIHWNAPSGIQSAVMKSLEIGVISTIAATALGTLLALAIVRHRFRGRGATNMLIFLPMSTPEIVLGASLLTLFLNRQIVTGFGTIFIAHVMFIVSYVVVTVKARLIDFDRHLEEAAMDLGANEWVTFRKVTLPLLAPAILSAALLGFALSIDDFVITYFVSGPTQTFPLFVWGAVRPQVNVVASAIFMVAVLVMIGNVLWGLRARRARESMPAAVPIPEALPRPEAA